MQKIFKLGITGALIFLCLHCASNFKPIDSSQHLTAKPQPIQEVLQSQDALYLFNFAALHYQKYLLQQLPDSLEWEMQKSENWLTLATPTLPFLPQQAAIGPNGNFFLFDKLGKRICQYDANAQLLACLDLPLELKRLNLEELHFYWNAGGLVFLHYAQGQVWQYSLFQIHAQNEEWQLRNTLKIPLGLRQCVYLPESQLYRCLRGERAIDFDLYFNEKTEFNPQDSLMTINGLLYNANTKSWIFNFMGKLAMTKKNKIFCFNPVSQSLSLCTAP